MTPNEQLAVLIAGARTFPDVMLVGLSIENIERAIETNSSGRFRVAGILRDELDRRGFGSEKFRNYRQLLRTAVTEAEANHG